jgi:hypothetical protein
MKIQIFPSFLNISIWGRRCKMDSVLDHLFRQSQAATGNETVAKKSKAVSSGR